MRLIDADELRKKFYNYTTESGIQVALDRYAVSCVGNAPTVDAVPVVRCKDCKYHFVDGENVRFNCCELNHNKVQSDDWFCADGERRSEWH